MKPYLEKAKKEIAALPIEKLECCARCDCDDFIPNVEAYELSGEIVCEKCAEEVFQENSQFGMGA